MVEHVEKLYPTAGAEGAAKSILLRVGDCFSGFAAARNFETEDLNSKPQGIPLASLSEQEALGVRGTRSRRLTPRSEMSDVSGLHIKDVMNMDLDELIKKYDVTVRAGVLRYVPEVEHGVAEEPEQKTWSLVRQSEFKEFQVWKRHNVWCFLHNARDIRCLLDCPWRPPCVFCAFQTFRVLSLVFALGMKTMFTALNMYSMLQAMPLELPPMPPSPAQYPA